MKIRLAMFDNVINVVHRFVQTTATMFLHNAPESFDVIPVTVLLVLFNCCALIIKIRFSRISKQS